MPTIKYEGVSYALEAGESVLEGLLRQGVNLPHSCKSGVCQSCLLRAAEGAPPEHAQRGLRDTYRAQGYFLACTCIPDNDLVVLPIDAAAMKVSARVESIDRLNATITRVTLRPERPFTYRPGQYVSVFREDGLVRSYSLASVPEEEPALDFHVMRVPGGQMSEWFHRGEAVGRNVDLLGPAGNCFYVPGNPEQPLLLAATGTGLAPLYGIVRDALRQGHSGPIHLFHGSVRPDGLYLVDRLQAMAEEFGQFRYYPCVLQSDGTPGIAEAPIDRYVLDTLGSLKGYKVYLCGNPDIVRQMQRKAFLAGAGLSAIYADAFLPSPAN
jgi:NAD(P)H-flavin reductase